MTFMISDYFLNCTNFIHGNPTDFSADTKYISCSRKRGKTHIFTLVRISSVRKGTLGMTYEQQDEFDFLTGDIVAAKPYSFDPALRLVSVYLDVTVTDYAMVKADSDGFKKLAEEFHRLNPGIALAHDQTVWVLWKGRKIPAKVRKLEVSDPSSSGKSMSQAPKISTSNEKSTTSESPEKVVPDTLSTTSEAPEKVTPDTESTTSEAQEKTTTTETSHANEAPDKSLPDSKITITEASETMKSDVKSTSSETSEKATLDSQSTISDAAEKTTLDTQGTASEASEKATPDTQSTTSEAVEKATPDTQSTTSEVAEKATPDTQSTTSEALEKATPDVPEKATPDTQSTTSEAPEKATPDTQSTTSEAPGKATLDAPEKATPDAQSTTSEAPEGATPDTLSETSEAPENVNLTKKKASLKVAAKGKNKKIAGKGKKGKGLKKATPNAASLSGGEILRGFIEEDTSIIFEENHSLSFPYSGLSNPFSNICNPSGLFGGAASLPYTTLSLGNDPVGTVGDLESKPFINPNFDFEKIGIGGLKKEFTTIFRRAFVSRVFPPEVIDKLGCKHVKGVLLYGPPGTGKTLMARQIAKMLNSRDPKIVCGPQIFASYVGQSEGNVRKLFIDAENEQKRSGKKSRLHVIIFDELDAICKKRDSTKDSSGVSDKVVTQLLAKMDGVEQLNNILIVGMTNKFDTIDEAFLRPGRFEVQMEIGLPSEEGRVQILNIHTSSMQEHKMLAPDVDLKELAVFTKNFSGADLEGLVRAAQSTAMNRLVKVSKSVEVDSDGIKNLVVDRKDFLYALENDVKPIYRTSHETLMPYLDQGFIIWGTPLTEVIDECKPLILQTRMKKGSGLITVLLEGEPNSGKTALAAHLAKISDFPFIKVCSPIDTVKLSEKDKCEEIIKVFDDAYQSELSCIIVDNMESIVEHSSVGPLFSNLTLQTLVVLLNKKPPLGKKLLIFCTTSQKEFFSNVKMLPSFNAILKVPNLSKSEHLITVLKESNVFTKDEVSDIQDKILDTRVNIGIKRLLDLQDRSQHVEGKDKIQKFLKVLEKEGFIGSPDPSSIFS